MRGGGCGGRAGTQHWRRASGSGSGSSYCLSTAPRASARASWPCAAALRARWASARTRGGPDVPASPPPRAFSPRRASAPALTRSHVTETRIASSPSPPNAAGAAGESAPGGGAPRGILFFFFAEACPPDAEKSGGMAFPAGCSSCSDDLRGGGGDERGGGRQREWAPLAFPMMGTPENLNPREIPPVHPGRRAGRSTKGKRPRFTRAYLTDISAVSRARRLASVCTPGRARTRFQTDETCHRG